MDHDSDVNDRGLPPPAGYVPSTSTSNIPYDEDQSHTLTGSKNSLDAKSVPAFRPRKGLISY
jgi:hypothetical protein